MPLLMQTAVKRVNEQRMLLCVDLMRILFQFTSTEPIAHAYIQSLKLTVVLRFHSLPLSLFSSQKLPRVKSVIE